MSWFLKRQQSYILDANSHAEQLPVLPGQYARLQIPDTEDRRFLFFATDQMRPINCNFIRLLPDGVMSNYLRDRCQVGQSLLIEAPLGSFYLREVDLPLVLWQVELVYQLSWECLITLVEQPNSPCSSVILRRK